MGAALASTAAASVSPTLSAAKRFNWQMATASPSTWVRLHTLSHGRGQTRPMIRGSGRRSLMIRTASASSPSAMAARYAGMSMPAGQA